MMSTVHFACYTQFVDYFDEGRRDHNYLGIDIQKYNERWPLRRDSIQGEIQLQEEAPRLQYTANFDLAFYVESPARGEWIKGLFGINLGIVVINGVPKISSIKEKVIRREKGLTGGGEQSRFAGTWRGMIKIDNVNFFTNDAMTAATTIRISRDQKSAYVDGGTATPTRLTDDIISWSFVNAQDWTCSYALSISPDGANAFLNYRAVRGNQVATGSGEFRKDR